MKNFWNAKIYSQFLDARSRPAKDLLAAIPINFEPKIVYDLGCGPGNSTVILKDRWSNAKVVGVDSSEDMLKKARADYPDIEFRMGDISQFNAPEKIDCIFANASLQWCDHHEKLFPHFIQSLNKNGVLAIQIPNNFHAAAHQAAIEILQANTQWNPLIQNLRYGILKNKFYQMPWYYDLFAQSGLQAIQLWETEYAVEMENHTGIFDWVKGTGLQPILSAMNDADKKLFEEKYIENITQKFQVQANKKVLFPFLRLFMVGVK